MYTFSLQLKQFCHEQSPLLFLLFVFIFFTLFYYLFLLKLSDSPHFFLADVFTSLDVHLEKSFSVFLNGPADFSQHSVTIIDNMICLHRAQLTALKLNSLLTKTTGDSCRALDINNTHFLKSE